MRGGRNCLFFCKYTASEGFQVRGDSRRVFDIGLLAMFSHSYIYICLCICINVLVAAAVVYVSLCYCDFDLISSVGILCLCSRFCALVLLYFYILTHVWLYVRIYAVCAFHCDSDDICWVEQTCVAEYVCFYASRFYIIFIVCFRGIFVTNAETIVRTAKRQKY